MSYKDKPQLRLYKFIDSAFVIQAIIDDFQDISFERNLYQAGTFTTARRQCAFARFGLQKPLFP